MIRPVSGCGHEGRVGSQVSRVQSPEADRRVSREVLDYDAAMWRRMRDDWDRLASLPGVGSAFTSTTWVDAWMEVFGARYQPTGVLWKDPDRRVVGCALLPTESRYLGPFAVRTAYLNASGPTGAFCEHNDVMVEPQYRGTVLADLVASVLGRKDLDELALIGIREAAADEIGSLWPAESWRGFLSESPYVALDALRAKGSDYLSELSRNTRSQVRRSIRLYQQQYGSPSVEVSRSAQEASEWFEQLVELHKASWRARGEDGVFSPDARAFHVRLIDRCHGADTGGLRATLLRIRFGRETIGVLYFLEHGRRVNFYQSGLVYEQHPRAKPGMVAHALAVQHYLGTGASEYDFLGGEPGSVRYKCSLATNVRFLAWHDLPAPKARNRLIARLRQIRDRLSNRRSA